MTASTNCFPAAHIVQRIFQDIICLWPTGIALLNQSVASHCHVDCGPHTYFEGKLPSMLIVEVKQGLNRPGYITCWNQQDVCSHPVRRRRAAAQNKKEPMHTWLLHDRIRSHQHSNVMVVTRCTCRWQLLRHRLLLDSLIWIFMNVVSRPHSIIGEIAWHGAPNPFAFAHVCLGALHFNQLQSVFYRGRLPPVLPVLWRKMRGKKNPKQYGLQVASNQKTKKQSIQEEDEWCFQG